jgi:hypothetical protein
VCYRGLGKIGCLIERSAWGEEEKQKERQLEEDEWMAGLLDKKKRKSGKKASPSLQYNFSKGGREISEVRVFDIDEANLPRALGVPLCWDLSEIRQALS